jgi:hypothetical protein
MGCCSLDYLSEELRALLDLALRTRLVPSNRNVSPNWLKLFDRHVSKKFWTAASGLISYLPVRTTCWCDTVVIYCPVSYPYLFHSLDLIQKCEEEDSFALRPIRQVPDTHVRFRGDGFEVRPSITA